MNATADWISKCRERFFAEILLGVTDDGINKAGDDGVDFYLERWFRQNRNFITEVDTIPTFAYDSSHVWHRDGDAVDAFVADYKHAFNVKEDGTVGNAKDLPMAAVEDFQPRLKTDSEGPSALESAQVVMGLVNDFLSDSTIDYTHDDHDVPQKAEIYVLGAAWQKVPEGTLVAYRESTYQKWAYIVQSIRFDYDQMVFVFDPSLTGDPVIQAGNSTPYTKSSTEVAHNAGIELSSVIDGCISIAMTISFAVPEIGPLIAATLQFAGGVENYLSRGTSTSDGLDWMLSQYSDEIEKLGMTKMLTDFKNAWEDQYGYVNSFNLNYNSRNGRASTFMNPDPFYKDARQFVGTIQTYGIGGPGDTFQQSFETLGSNAYWRYGYQSYIAGAGMELLNQREMLLLMDYLNTHQPDETAYPLVFPVQDFLRDVRKRAFKLNELTWRLLFEWLTPMKIVKSDETISLHAYNASEKVECKEFDNPHLQQTCFFSHYNLHPIHHADYYGNSYYSFKEENKGELDGVIYEYWAQEVIDNIKNWLSSDNVKTLLDVRSNWLGSRQTWGSRLTAPMVQPTDKIQFDSLNWNDDCTDDSYDGHTHWVRGNKVRYALRFEKSTQGVNDSDNPNSAMYNWSDWIGVGDYRYPSLIHLQTDPYASSDYRNLFRQFMHDKNGNSYDSDAYEDTLFTSADGGWPKQLDTTSTKYLDKDG